MHEPKYPRKWTISIFRIIWITCTHKCVFTRNIIYLFNFLSIKFCNSLVFLAQKPITYVVFGSLFEFCMRVLNIHILHSKFKLHVFFILTVNVVCLSTVCMFTPLIINTSAKIYEQVILHLFEFSSKCIN